MNIAYRNLGGSQREKSKDMAQTYQAQIIKLKGLIGFYPPAK
jgi:hypothetical protein